MEALIRKRKPGNAGNAFITVWATRSQWKAVADLANQANWSETDLGKRAGFTKGQWRDFYSRLKAAGLLVPKGNGPKAGYKPSDGFLLVLEKQPWRG